MIKLKLLALSVVFVVLLIVGKESKAGDIEQGKATLRILLQKHLDEQAKLQAPKEYKQIVSACVGATYFLKQEDDYVYTSKMPFMLVNNQSYIEVMDINECPYRFTGVILKKYKEE